MANNIQESAKIVANLLLNTPDYIELIRYKPEESRKFVLYLVSGIKGGVLPQSLAKEILTKYIRQRKEMAKHLNEGENDSLRSL